MSRIFSEKSGIDLIQINPNNTVKNYTKASEAEDGELKIKGEVKKTKKGFQSILDTILPDNQAVIPSVKTEQALLEQPPLLFYNELSGSSGLSESSPAGMFQTSEPPVPIQADSMNQKSSILTQEEQTIQSLTDKEGTAGQIPFRAKEEKSISTTDRIFSSVENNEILMEENALEKTTQETAGFAGSDKITTQDIVQEVAQDVPESVQPKPVQAAGDFIKPDKITIQNAAQGAAQNAAQDVSESVQPKPVQAAGGFIKPDKITAQDIVQKAAQGAAQDVPESVQPKPVQAAGGFIKPDKITIQDVAQDAAQGAAQDVPESVQPKPAQAVSDFIKPDKITAQDIVQEVAQDAPESVESKSGQAIDEFKKPDTFTIWRTSVPEQPKTVLKTDHSEKTDNSAAVDKLELLQQQIVGEMRTDRTGSVISGKEKNNPAAVEMSSLIERKNSDKLTKNAETDKKEKTNPFQNEKITDNFNLTKKGENESSNQSEADKTILSMNTKNSKEATEASSDHFATLVQQGNAKQNNQDISLPDIEVTQTTRENFKASPLAEKMVKSIQYLQKGKEGESLVIKLKPEQYGELHIKITQHGSIIETTIHTNDPSMQTLLTENINQLKESLSRQGISCDQININLQMTSQDNSKFQNNQAQDGREQARESVLKTIREGKTAGKAKLQNYYQRDQGRINLLA